MTSVLTRCYYEDMNSEEMEAMKIRIAQKLIAADDRAKIWDCGDSNKDTDEVAYLANKLISLFEDDLDLDIPHSAGFTRLAIENAKVWAAAA